MRKYLRLLYFLRLHRRLQPRFLRYRRRCSKCSGGRRSTGKPDWRGRDRTFRLRQAPSCLQYRRACLRSRRDGRRCHPGQGQNLLRLQYRCQGRNRRLQFRRRGLNLRRLHRRRQVPNLHRCLRNRDLLPLRLLRQRYLRFLPLRSYNSWGHMTRRATSQRL